MQLLRKVRIAAVFALSLTAGPLTAQAYHWDLGINGGYQGSTNALSNNDVLFFNNNTNVNPLIVTNNGAIVATDINNGGSLGFKSGGIFGAQAGYWFTHNIGFRVNGAYAMSGFKQSRFTNFDNSINNCCFNNTDFSSSNDLVNDLHTWSATGDLMYRFVKPRPKFEGVEWLPYAAGGLGAQWVAGGNNAIGVGSLNDTFPLVGTQLTGNRGTAIVCVRGFCQGPNSLNFIGLGLNNALLDTTTFFIKNAARFTGLLALGTDIRVAKQFGFRVEVGDRIWQAPIYRATQRIGFTDAVFLGDRVGKTINQFYITGGGSVLFGLEPAPPEPVAVRPAPAPPPPAPPATESISVCVVDPTVQGGLRNVDAQRNLSSGDTTVYSNGSTVSLSSTLQNVPVVGNADWFLAGRPLEFGTKADKLQYVTVGGPRVINAQDLAYLGSVNGLPVYVDKSLLGPIEGLTPGTDLSMTVDTRPLLRQAIEDKVPVVYVPTQQIGCTFQPMQIVAKVKKDH